MKTISETVPHSVAEWKRIGTEPVYKAEYRGFELIAGMEYVGRKQSYFVTIKQNDAVLSHDESLPACRGWTGAKARAHAVQTTDQIIRSTL